MRDKKDDNPLSFPELVEVTQRCISIPSLSGREGDLIKYLIRAAARLNFTSVSTDRVGNLIAEAVVGSGRGPKIVLTGHTDVVNADPAAWSPETRPWTGAVRGGRLYGRGAVDMKASLAAMLFAAGGAALLPRGHNGKVYLVGTVVEELFEGICFLEALKEIRPDYVIVGEATRGRLNIGQRGRAEISITTFGQSKHASTGRKVINAIEQIAFIIEAFHRWYRSDIDQVLGKRNIVPTDIKIPVGGGGGLDGRGGNSTVPNMAEITYDIRTLVEDTPASILRLVRENIERVVRNGREKYPNFRDPRISFSSEAARTWTGVSIERDKFAPAWKTEPDTELVKRARAGIREETGSDPGIGHYSFCTDGSAIPAYRGLFPESGIEVIGYGPGGEEDAHTVNESISLDELETAYRGFQGICRSLLRAGE
jgi:putative selenium metabolism hydrolase